jgi:hypothetical protein
MRADDRRRKVAKDLTINFKINNNYLKIYKNQPIKDLGIDFAKQPQQTKLQCAHP